MKVEWLKAMKCPKCHRAFGPFDIKRCVRCGTDIPHVAVVTDIPSGRYLMNFCTCPLPAGHEPLTTRDSEGHLHLKLLAADAHNTLNAGEEH